MPINPFQLPLNVTSADLQEYIKHRAQNPFNAAVSVATEKTIPSQTTTTDQELRLNECIHKHWQDRYKSLQQQQQQQLDQTIFSFNIKESKLLEKQFNTNEKLYQFQLEQDQLKRELEEAKFQLEQVRLQTEDTSSSSDEDVRQKQEAYSRRSKTNHRAVNRHHSLPILRDANITNAQHSNTRENPVRRDTAFPQEDPPHQLEDPFLKYEWPKQTYDNSQTNEHHNREPFSASQREYQPLSDTRPDDYEEPFQFHRTGYIPNEEKYGHDLDMFRHTKGYRRETRGSTQYSPPVRLRPGLETLYNIKVGFSMPKHEKISLRCVQTR